MARKRTIDPDSWTDDKLAELSVGAHLLWVGLVSLADDEGRLKWSAGQFKRRLFPSKADVTIALIEKWMEEIVSSTGDDDTAPVVVYKANGRFYAYHVNWRKNQYVNKPSKSILPPPDTFYSSNSGSSTESNGSSTWDDDTHAEDSISLPDSSVPSVSVSVSVSESVSVSGTGERERAREFALFFYRAAVVDDLIQDVPDPSVWASTYRGEATELLRLYGEEQCQARALAFIRAIKTGKIRRAPELRYLRECWNWREVQAELSRSVAPSVYADNPIVVKLREAQERSERQRAERERAAQGATA